MLADCDALTTRLMLGFCVQVVFNGKDPQLWNQHFGANAFSPRMFHCLDEFKLVSRHLFIFILLLSWHSTEGQIVRVTAQLCTQAVPASVS